MVPIYEKLINLKENWITTIKKYMDSNA